MNERKRVLGQPAFLLHQRNYRDTSQIVDLFTRQHGRIAVVARGVRSPRSKFRGLLRAFTPLSVSWSSRGDLGTLTDVEITAESISLRDDWLMAAYYVTELILRLTHRHDPQPELFAQYLRVLTCFDHRDQLQRNLRLFELRLLSLLGYGLTSQHNTADGSSLDAEKYYRFRPLEGPQEVAGKSSDTMVFSGRQILAIAEERLDSEELLNAARKVTRATLDFCLEGRELNSRKVLIALRRHESQLEKMPD